MDCGTNERCRTKTRATSLGKNDTKALKDTYPEAPRILPSSHPPVIPFKLRPSFWKMSAKLARGRTHPIGKSRWAVRAFISRGFQSECGEGATDRCEPSANEEPYVAQSICGFRICDNRGREYRRKTTNRHFYVVLSLPTMEEPVRKPAGTDQKGSVTSC